ncbi:MAG: rod shape-determining protein [Eubacterium sp.]|nr:rod shape-determining protein [Eubacterium sp.]
MAAVTDIGIDLGTSTIAIYVRGKGIIIREPALVAYDTDAGKVRAIGDEARQLVGHTTGNNVAIKPLAQGKISDFMIIERMLRYFIDKALGRRGLLKPRISICVPGGVTEIEKRAVIEATYQAGAREVTLVKEPIAAAIGAELDITRPDGNMVIDIGGGLTDIAVISLCGIVVSSSIPVAGDNMTRAIVSFLRSNYGLFIGEQTAESIKLKLGSANSSYEKDKLTINGRNVASGLPKTVTLTRSDVQEALRGPVRQIVEAVRNVLERTPPDLAADLQERGIVLTGGGCQVEGLEDILERQTGLHVMTAQNPGSVVALGTWKYASVLDEFENR